MGVTGNNITNRSHPWDSVLQLIPTCCLLLLYYQLLVSWILNVSKACSIVWVLPKSLCWHHLATL